MSGVAITREQLSELAAAVTRNISMHIERRMTEALGEQVHAAAMRIVEDEAESVIRAAIRDAVRARVEITVTMK